MAPGEVIIPYFTLNNGVRMPGVGLGCWLGPEGGLDVAEDMCADALRCGYRHFDTAKDYANEECVGRAIRASGIPRAEVFVTTKIPPRDAHRVHAAFEDSLAALGLEYIDLYLIHWPMTHTPDGSYCRSLHEHPNFVDVWADMEKLLDTGATPILPSVDEETEPAQGKVRAIGVSNFSIKNLEILLNHARIVPAVNQVEIHPYLPQHGLKAYCESKGILLSAYSPFGQGNPHFFDDADLVQIARAHRATVAQITMSWLVQRGTPPIAKSANAARRRENISLVRLTHEEMARIDHINVKSGAHRSLVTYPSRPTAGTVFGWTYEQLGWSLDVDRVVRG